MAAGGLIFFDAEIDRAIGGTVSHAAGDQFFDEGNNRRDVFGGVGGLVRTKAIEGLEILEEGGLVFGGVIAQGSIGFADAPDDFVLHVGDVHDVADLEALELQAAPHQIGEHEGAEVADVGEVMHGGAAAIEAGGLAGRVARDEFLDRAGQGVEEFQFSKKDLSADSAEKMKKGDKVTIFVKLDGDRIVEARFEGHGCAISTASASLMTEIVKNKTLAEADALFQNFHTKVTGGEQIALPAALEDDGDRLEPLAGVKSYPARVKCATLAWHTFEAAMHAGSIAAAVKTE